MKKKIFVFLILLLVAGVAFAGWKQAYDQGDELADADAFLYVDVSDTTMATTGTTKYIEWSDIEDHLDTLYQGLDSDLTTYAGITPSANVQTLLGADNFAAFKTSLSLDSVENTALSTWSGTTNLDIGETAFTDLTDGSSYSGFSGNADDDTLNELFAAISNAISAGTSFSDLGNCTGDVDIDAGVNEEISFTFSGAFTTGSQFSVVQDFGNPTGGVLFEVKAADSDIAAMKVGDGTNTFNVSQVGKVTFSGTAGIVVPFHELSAATLTDSNLDLETTDAGEVQVLTIAGLTADRSVILPELTGSGRIYKVAILDGDDTYDVLLDPDGTDQIIGTSAAGDYLAADDAGDFIVIVDIADGYGLVSEKQGTWTEE